MADILLEERVSFIEPKLVSGNYTLVKTDVIVIFNSPTSSILSLPTNATFIGKRVTVHNIENGIVTVPGVFSGTGVIDIKLSFNDTITFYYSGTNWLESILSKPELICYSATTQAITTANTPQLISFELNTLVNKITKTSNTRFTFTEGGIYTITGIFQLNTTGTNDTLNIWVRKNGVNVPDSNSKFGLEAALSDQNTPMTQTISAIEGDYVEIWMQGDAPQIQLQYNPITGQVPATSSAIITIRKLY